MLRKLAILLLIISCTACKKNQKSACGTQVCTDIFVSVGVTFKDKADNGVSVTNYSVTDLRTGQKLTNAISPGANFVPGYMVIVDDSNLPDLSTDGDDVQVSGTNPATHETKTATFKIAGGCNCHVSKISGPQVIVFSQ